MTMANFHETELSNCLRMQISDEGLSSWQFTATSATSDWLAGVDASIHVESPVWTQMVTHVASLRRKPNTILDLAAGPGEPGCSLAACFPAATVTVSDSVPAMISAASKRVRALGLSDRVKVEQMDMRDLSSVATESHDLVTNCLGLHLISPEELVATLSQITRVLKPGGHFIAVVWEDAPLLEASLLAMEDITRRPWPKAKMRCGGGAMDSMWANAHLHVSRGHNTIHPMPPTNLGSMDDGPTAKWWVDGPFSLLGGLKGPLGQFAPDQLEMLQEYFRVRFQSHGLVNARRELEYVQSRRLLAVVKPFQIKVR
jgi:trans-aconitate methyltransferase